MYSDQAFLLLSAAAVLLEMAAVCWVWERKMKQAAQREREAEQLEGNIDRGEVVLLV